MTLKIKDIEKNLLRKGFILENRHHKYFVFKNKDIDTEISTKISRSHSEIGDDLISKMAKQIHMSKDFFKDFVDCAKSEEDYIQILKDSGMIE